MGYLKKQVQGLSALFVMLTISVVTFTSASAADTDVTQQINPGALSTAVLDSGRSVVASPTFAMTVAPFSFDCQTTTGSLGSSSQRIYIINPSATAGTGWTLSINGSGDWTSGSNTYSFDDATSATGGAGCANGQLTLNPAAATLTDDCISTGCTSAVVTQGSSTAMTGSAVTLLNAATNAATVYRGYLTGIGLSQKIPGETPSGSYILEMTVTAAAS